MHRLSRASACQGRKGQRFDLFDTLSGLFSTYTSTHKLAIEPMTGSTATHSGKFYHLYHAQRDTMRYHS
jgi:hypothetical protein